MSKQSWVLGAIVAVCFSSGCVHSLKNAVGARNPSSAEQTAQELMATIKFVKVPGANFEIMDSEVTQAQWVAAMGQNVAYHKYRMACPQDYIGDDPQVTNQSSICPNLPVESVSYDQAQGFVAYLQAFDYAHTYSIPTQAQWEHAARGGVQDQLPANLISTIWFAHTAGDQQGYVKGARPHAVKTKAPNAYGLYDMLGNVWEWVADTDREDQQIFRGGAFDSVPQNLYFSCDSVGPYSCARSSRNGYPQVSVGFRVVRVPR